MRFSLFSLLSSLAVIATVNAFPVVSRNSDVTCCVAPGVSTNQCEDCLTHNASLSTRTDQAILMLAQNDPAQFLTQHVFPNLIVDEFRYGMGSNGGLIQGSKMISQYITESAGNTKLAIHLYSIVTASGLQNNAMTITVKSFHLTARSVASQQSIDSHPSNIPTALPKSIHISLSPNKNKWGPPNYVRNLQQEIGANPVSVLKSSGYSLARVASLKRDFKTAVETHIQQLLGASVTVRWMPGDDSFPEPPQ